MSAQHLADDEIPVQEPDRLRLERYDAPAGDVFGGRRVVFMNEVDMRRRGISIGALVEIESVAKDRRTRLVRKFVACPYDIPSGSVAAYYPETKPLLPLGYHFPKRRTPAAKSIPVFVRAMATT
jgi:anaerobic selenocysteine-containing dehydrogenase